jgi:hypothetical protein
MLLLANAVSHDCVCCGHLRPSHTDAIAAVLFGLAVDEMVTSLMVVLSERNANWCLTTGFLIS